MGCVSFGLDDAEGFPVPPSDCPYRGKREPASLGHRKRFEDRANFKNILMKAGKSRLPPLRREKWRERERERALLLSALCVRGLRLQDQGPGPRNKREEGGTPALQLPSLRGSEEYVKYLDQVSVLDSLLAEEKKQVANALVELLGQVFSFFLSAVVAPRRSLLRMHFERNDVIIQQGEPGNMSLPQLRETKARLRLRKRACVSGSTSCMKERRRGSRAHVPKGASKGGDVRQCKGSCPRHPRWRLSRTTPCSSLWRHETSCSTVRHLAFARMGRTACTAALSRAASPFRDRDSKR